MQGPNEWRVVIIGISPLSSLGARSNKSELSAHDAWVQAVLGRFHCDSFKRHVTQRLDKICSPDILTIFRGVNSFLSCGRKSHNHTLEHGGLRHAKTCHLDVCLDGIGGGFIDGSNLLQGPAGSGHCVL